MSSGPVEPTIVFESRSDPSSSQGDLPEVSKAKIGFVEGTRPRFADETAQLLRGRLTAASLALSIILLAVFIETMITAIYDLWWFRGIVLGLLFGCWFVLRGDYVLSLPQLRVIEFVEIKLGRRDMPF